MAAKDRLTPKNSGGAQASLNVQTPPVRVRMPEIKVPAINIPEIKIPEIKVSADMQPVASAIQAIGGAIAELGAQQARLAEQQSMLLEAIKTIASKAPSKTARPKSYTVDFDKEDGETVGMRVKVG
jgi:hypothetical protein